MVSTSGSRTFSVQPSSAWVAPRRSQDTRTAAREMNDIAAEMAGGHDLASAAEWPAVDTVSAERLWEVRHTLRRRLVTMARAAVRVSWLRRGATQAELGWTENVLDPEVLTIGFARRVSTYKRLTLMLRDPDRLCAGSCSTRTARYRSSWPARRTRPTTVAK